MLVLGRFDGEWVEATHVGSGDQLRFRVYKIRDGECRLAFDDPQRRFRFLRLARDMMPPGGAR